MAASSEPGATEPGATEPGAGKPGAARSGLRLPGREETAAAARALIRTRRSAVLATALATDGGWPYASLVTVACDVDGSPITLFSALSDHTRNLAADPRASLLLEDASRRANPQTGPRATLLGRLVPDDDPRLRRRFLATHPGAAQYADFGDFRFFRMAVERVHWVGGFARARWLGAPDVLADAEGSRRLAEAEPEILDRVGREDAEAIDRCARSLLRRAGRGWRIVAIDPEGCDLRRGETAFARLPFPAPVAEPADFQAALRECFEAAARAEAGSLGSGDEPDAAAAPPTD